MCSSVLFFTHVCGNELLYGLRITIPYKLDLNSNKTKRITLTAPSSKLPNALCAMSFGNYGKCKCRATKVPYKTMDTYELCLSIVFEVETLRGSLFLFIVR